MPKPCVRCGCEKTRDKFGRLPGKNCRACQKIVYAEMECARKVIFNRPCVGCGKPVKRASLQTTLCSGCRDVKTRVVAKLYGRPYQQLASAFVASAIKHGDLAALDGSISCVDCGSPATCYEHRDYWLPLQVDAVCQSCNLKRGPAKHHPKVARTREEILRMGHALECHKGFALIDMAKRNRKPPRKCA